MIDDRQSYIVSVRTACVPDSYLPQLCFDLFILILVLSLLAFTALALALTLFNRKRCLKISVAFVEISCLNAGICKFAK